MKKGFANKRHYFILPVFILAVSIALILNANAQVGPGWQMGIADPVSHEDAHAYYVSMPASAAAQGITAMTASSTTVTPEIEELARALEHDPKLIYDYVHNHID
jgi:hypothetical protein